MTRTICKEKILPFLHIAGIGIDMVFDFLYYIKTIEKEL